MSILFGEMTALSLKDDANVNHRPIITEGLSRLAEAAINGYRGVWCSTNHEGYRPVFESVNCLACLAERTQLIDVTTQ